ncbi:MAG: DNA internalization-related competence protein ComEC/Rec2 [Syntrophobacteraceae bacterium]
MNDREDAQEGNIHTVHGGDADMYASALPRLLFPPLFLLAAAFAAGIAASRISSLPGPGIESMWIAAASISLLVLFAFHPFRRLRRPWSALILFLALGFALGRSAAPEMPAPPALEPFFDRPQTVFLAEAAGPADFYPDKTRVPLRLKSALSDSGLFPLHAGVLLTIGGARKTFLDIVPGDRLVVRLSLKRFHSFNNPGGYDYVRNQAEKGLHARAFLPDEHRIVKLAPERGMFGNTIGHPLRSRIERFRQEALFWLQRELPRDTAAFYGALLLGYQHLLTSEWQEHSSRAGVTHLLSIGGMHLSLVSLAVFWLTCRAVRTLRPSLLRRHDDQHIALFPALLAATLYAVVSGFAVAPIWRSTIMLLLCFSAACWYRQANPLSVLGAAALLILAVTPNAIGSIPFQLTFLCMFAIFSIYPRLQRFQSPRWHPVFSRAKPLGKFLHPFEEAFWISVAVNIAVIPVTAYYFKGISLASFAANILLVPLVGFLVIPPGLAALAVFSMSGILALPVLQFGAWFLSVSQSLILWFSNLSWAFFQVGSVPVTWLLCYYSALALLLASLRPKAKIVCLALVLVLACGITGAGHVSFCGKENGTLQVVAVDVGQGTSTLVRFPSGEVMLVDGGGYFDDSFDMGRSVLAPFLWSSGISRLDGVVLSHDHPDHANGLRFILSHFDIGAYRETGLTGTPGEHTSLRSIAERRKIPVDLLQELPREEKIGPCRLHILHPSSDYLLKNWNGDLNNASLVLAVEYGETIVIIPGDVDASVEEHLLREFPASSNVLLIAPHHGSDRSCGSLLLDRLHPQAMIISCGFDNFFGFPSGRILEECSRRGIPCFRTDLCGAVCARSDGGNWSVRTMNSCPRPGGGQ